MFNNGRKPWQRRNRFVCRVASPPPPSESSNDDTISVVYSEDSPITNMETLPIIMAEETDWEDDDSTSATTTTSTVRREVYSPLAEINYSPTSPYPPSTLPERRSPVSQRSTLIDYNHEDLQIQEVIDLVTEDERDEDPELTAYASALAQGNSPITSYWLLNRNEERELSTTRLRHANEQQERRRRKIQQKRKLLEIRRRERRERQERERLHAAQLAEQIAINRRNRNAERDERRERRRRLRWREMRRNDMTRFQGRLSNVAPLFTGEEFRMFVTIIDDYIIDDQIDGTESLIIRPFDTEQVFQSFFSFALWNIEEGNIDRAEVVEWFQRTLRSGHLALLMLERDLY